MTELFIRAKAAEARVEDHNAFANERDKALERALGIMEKFAAQPPPDVHVTIPEREVHLNVQPPDVKVEPKIEVAAPVIPAPHVTVTPEVHVEPPPAPDVHVTVEQPRPSAVRATRETDGSTVFTVEEETEE